MGEKEGKGEKEKKGAVDGGEKKKEGGGEKKEEGPPTVILKADMHCEGCASKIKRFVRRFEGVEGVTIDTASNKLTVTGKVDPWMLRDHLEAKTRKKVEILSPVNPPKKDADGGDKKPTAAAESKDQKKSKESAASTVVLQIRLHCDGCIRRIKKTILKVKGVQEVNVDAQKNLVTVKGTMDVNSLPLYLKDKLKRGVEIVPAKTSGGSGGGGGGGGGEKKDKAVGEKAKEKEGGGGGEKKEERGGGEKEGAGGEKKAEAVKAVAAAAMATTPAVETNFLDYYNVYGPYEYRAEKTLHAPQYFSDENPNACSVM